MTWTHIPQGANHTLIDIIDGKLQSVNLIVPDPNWTPHGYFTIYNGEGIALCLHSKGGYYRGTGHPEPQDDLLYMAGYATERFRAIRPELGPQIESVRNSAFIAFRYLFSGCLWNERLQKSVSQDVRRQLQQQIDQLTW